MVLVHHAGHTWRMVELEPHQFQCPVAPPPPLEPLPPTSPGIPYCYVHNRPQLPRVNVLVERCGILEHVLHVLHIFRLPPLMFWLKAAAPSNMYPSEVTLLVCHAPMFWLKTPAL